MNRTVLGVALAALLSSPVLADDFTDKATAALDKVEQEMPDQKPGDKAGGKRLGDEVNAARDILKQSKEKTADDWKAQDARSKDLIAKINARYKEKPAPGGASSGAPLGVMDRRNLDDFHANCEGWTKELQAAQPAEIGADGGKWKSCSAKLRAFLGKIKDQQNADVQAALARADEFDQYYASRLEDGKKAAANQAQKDAGDKQDVDKQVADLQGFFDEKTFTCELKAPFDDVRVRAWIAQLKQYRDMGAKGNATLDKIVADHPTYAKDPRISRLRVWFQTRMPQLMKMGIDRTANSTTSEGTTAKGRLPAAMEMGLHWTAPDIMTEKRLADEKWVALVQQQLHDGIEAALALQTFRKEYEGKDDAESAKALADMSAAQQRLEAGAKGSIDSSRMPASKSTDADLIAAATDALKNPDYGCKGFERLVINYDKHHEKETRKDGSIEGDYIVVRTTVYEWDEFQVTVAEKDGDGLRMVCYDLQNYSSGDHTTPLGRWIVHQRMPGQRILRENVAR